MKKSKSFSIILITAFVIIAVVLVSFQVQKINVSGTWNMSVETSQGSGTPVLVLKQVNDSIVTGTYTGQFGQADLKGVLKSNKINLRISTSDVTIDYIGTVNGNNMTGKVVFGEYGEGTFTGKKKEN